MLQFSERKNIVNVYEKFIKENQVLESNNLTFLNFLYSEGLLNDKTCENYLDKIYRIGEKEDESN